MTNMRSGIEAARAVVHAFGMRGLARRSAYVGRLRTGLVRRATPQRPDFSSYAPLEWRHSFDMDAIRTEYSRLGLEEPVREQVVAEAEALLQGSLRFYGGQPRQVGWPPAWHRFPDGSDGPSPLHWTRMSDDLPADVKDLWEPSRFGFTFLLARAYLLTGDDQWPQAWWQALEDWAAANPPNSGVNWRCGQESALRGIAWCFGLSVFGTHESSTPVRLDLLQRMLGATVQRVRPTIGYALSQRNNHALSELVFLLAVRPDAQLERLLRESLRDQFYEDGSYSQQSLNYQRLAMHGMIWLLHVQQGLGDRTAALVRSCLAGAGSFLRRCSDPVSDRLPNSGANDGALLLDLDSVPRWDAGPTLSLVGMASRSMEAGVWFPSARLRLPLAQPSSSTAFVTMRGPASLLLTHVGPSRHRPGDDDQQSTEVIIDGAPVVLDPGSFRYSGVGPWRQPFVAAQAHNAAHEPHATRAAIGRFLRERKPPARVVEHRLRDDVEVLVTERPLGTGVAHRAVVRLGDQFAVVDHVVGVTAELRWLIDQARVDMVQVESPRPPQVSDRVGVDPLSGWWAPLYGERWPAVAMVVALGNGESSVVRVGPLGAAGLSGEQLGDALRAHPHLARGADVLHQQAVGQR
jgi:hypothetical protein